MVTICSPELWPLSSVLNSVVFQVQGDKEKLLYELDTLQAELEKCNMSSSRLQKEKEDAYADIDRGREKYEKLQVSSCCSCQGPHGPDVCVATLFSPHTALN